MQVTLGICSNGLWKDVTGISLLQSLAVFPHSLHIAAERGPHIDENREAIVKQALSAKSDVLVFVDSDMVWPMESLNRLLEVGQGKDILGVAYNEKRLPPVSTVKMWNGKGEIFVGVKEMPHEPFKSAAVGTGFMLIDLKRLVECWPEGPYFEFGSTGGLGRVGEDVAFCLAAEKHGLTVWCDPRIKVKHVGDYLY